MPCLSCTEIIPRPCPSTKELLCVGMCVWHRLSLYLWVLLCRPVELWCTWSSYQDSRRRPVPGTYSLAFHEGFLVFLKKLFIYF